MLTSILLPLSLLPFAAAHFKLNYPPARGFDEDTLSTFPCGGQNTVSSNRTAWPLTGGPIQLLMGHTASQVEVLIALGNDDTTAFNTVLVPTLQEDGPNNFCLGAVRVPTTIGGVTLAAGMNATIQVVTNGDSGGGGLYNVRQSFFCFSPFPLGQFRNTPRLMQFLSSDTLPRSTVRGRYIHIHATLHCRLRVILHE